jgi:HKD family nuclease
MAELDFILQAVTKAHHAQYVRALLALPNPGRIVVSVAFARASGIAEIEDCLGPVATQAKFFVGIRNDITSLQAVKKLLALKVDVYAVDTGTRQVIFHPKLYLAASATHGMALIGSANLTLGGLGKNIEFSTRLAFDFVKNAADKVFLDGVLTAFEDMQAAHPEHVFKIESEQHATQLLEEGRLVDESVVLAPHPVGHITQGSRDNLVPMQLFRGKPNKAPSAIATPPAAVPDKTKKGIKYLVWKSKPLSARALSIPEGRGTNPTGSMGLTKGLYDHIDQRHFFFKEVFQELAWAKKTAGAETLHATAEFELIVKNVNCGVFNLMLSHKTNTKSKTYLQGNFMTQLHWGDARALVGQKDLLGRTLCLYRKDGQPPRFTLEID